jgi:PTS system glucose-specific IIC component
MKKVIQSFGEIDQSKIKPPGSIKEVIAKLSRGLMLPIAMLPIAGLFLGIGSTIVNQTASGSGANVFGYVLSTTGNAIFACLPVLFAIAIAISFTKDSGTAALSAFVGWLIFNAFQFAIIIKKGDPTQTTVTNSDGYQFL